MTRLNEFQKPHLVETEVLVFYAKGLYKALEEAEEEYNDLTDRVEQLEKLVDAAIDANKRQHDYLEEIEQLKARIPQENETPVQTYRRLINEFNIALEKQEDEEDWAKGMDPQ
jgi:predicted  nucleic acid-binding Zn-ribbon protein